MPTPADDPPTIRPSDLAGDDQMSVTWHRPHPQAVLLRVFGEVDLSAASRLRRVLDDAVRHAAPNATTTPPPDDDDADGRPHLVCDLSGLAFLGAAGLGALVEADHVARTRGARLQVVVGSRRVRRVLALSGLDRHLDTVDQLVDARPSVLRPASERSA